MRTFDPVQLVGKAITLAPLRPLDTQDLSATVSDGELWTTPTTVIPRPEEMQRYIDRALAEHARGECVPYIIRLNDTGQAVGSIRTCKINRRHRRLEIGHIWLGRSFQGRRFHTEANYLLLCHVFDVGDFLRAQYLADETNAASRRAIRALGAIEEGVLRCERVMPGGRVRNTVVSSIVRDEWPTIRLCLRDRLYPESR